MLSELQLDCLSFRHWEYVIAFAVGVRFQIRDQFWIPSPNYTGQSAWFFCKTSKQARYASFRETVSSRGFSGTKSTLWAQIDFLVSRKHMYYERNSSSLNTTFKKIKETMFRAKLSSVRASTILSSACSSAGLPYITKNSFPGQTEAPQKGSIPLNKSIWLFWKMSQKIDHTIFFLRRSKFSSSRAFKRWSRNCRALLVRPEIDSLCVSTGSPIQL